MAPLTTTPGNEEMKEMFQTPITSTKEQPFEVLESFTPETVTRKKPTIVTREEWGAVPPTKVEASEKPLYRIFITLYSETPPCYNREECMRIVKDLQTRHMEELGLSDIKYNFLVGGDGNIYEGRGWDAKSSRTLEFNPGMYYQRFDIAYIGDFRHVPNPPYNMLEAALEFVFYGEFLKFINPLRDLFVMQGDKEGDWSKWPHKTYLAPGHEDPEVAMFQTVVPVPDVLSQTPPQV